MLHSYCHIYHEAEEDLLAGGIGCELRRGSELILIRPLELARPGLILGRAASRRTAALSGIRLPGRPAPTINRASGFLERRRQVHHKHFRFM